MQQNRIYVNGAPHRFWIPQRCCFVVRVDIIDLAYFQEFSQTLSGFAWTYRLVFCNMILVTGPYERESRKKSKRVCTRRWKERTILW